MSDEQPASNLSPTEQAQLADQLIKNPLLEAIFIEMDHQATMTWRRSTSPGQREDQWHLVVAIAMLRKSIESRAESIKIQAEQRHRRNRPTV